MIISFAWTTPALLAGAKTMTRRDWDPDYARRFKAGMLVDAYDRSPRARGKKIATIRLTRDVYLQRIRGSLTPEVQRREGFDWLREHGEAVTVDRIIRDWYLNPDLAEWVVEFELVECERCRTIDGKRTIAVTSMSDYSPEPIHLCAACAENERDER